MASNRQAMAVFFWLRLYTLKTYAVVIFAILIVKGAQVFAADREWGEPGVYRCVVKLSLYKLAGSMSFLKSLFGRKAEKTSPYSAFWSWFQTREREFHRVTRDRGDVNQVFLNVLQSRLQEIRPGFYALAGLVAPDTVQLIFTAEGAVKNFPFVEELVQHAPVVNGWVFEALKPAIVMQGLDLEMRGLKFNTANLFFQPVEPTAYPDAIDLLMIYSDYTPQNEEVITRAVYVYLENLLGELRFATVIDNLTIKSKTDVSGDIIPIGKLNNYLTWREKEFVEKYDGVRYSTANDRYRMMEGRMKNGDPILAVVNNDLMFWDKKVSHPWILVVDIAYGNTGTDGLPGTSTATFLNDIEEKLRDQLKDDDGCLNIGRETGGGHRVLYFACSDFKIPSKIADQFVQAYRDTFPIAYEITRDKYWRSLERFVV